MRRIKSKKIHRQAKELGLTRAAERRLHRTRPEKVIHEPKLARAREDHVAVTASRRRMVATAVRDLGDVGQIRRLARIGLARATGLPMSIIQDLTR